MKSAFDFPFGQVDPFSTFSSKGTARSASLFINPWIALVVIAAAVAIPVGAYLMLDPSQRRRLKRIQERKQLGR